MLRAAGTAITGLGVTIVSTFAGSLGLSVHQQRWVFGLGVALMVLGAGLLVHGWRRPRKPTSEPIAQSPAGLPVPDPVWQALAVVMHDGGRLLSEYDRAESLNGWLDRANRWAWEGRDEIEALTDPTEAALFAQAGSDQPSPRSLSKELTAKVEYIRNNLQPKAREGYWAFHAPTVELRRQKLAHERTKAELAGLRAQQEQLETRKKAAAKATESTANLQAELDAMQPALREMEKELERGQRERHAHEYTKLASDFEGYLARARATRPMEPRLTGDMFDRVAMRENEVARSRWERELDEWRRETLGHLSRPVSRRRSKCAEGRRVEGR
jgi:hypothetical protein